jgi:YHS domain-containing protein
MKETLKLMMAVAMMAFVAFNAAADDKKLKPQENCPVMKSKINKALYVDVDGKRIYVCCKGCIAPIKKKPAKYIKKLEKMGEAPAVLQTKCPVMGSKINKKLFVDVNGKRIYVCCNGCQAPIKKDPAGHIKKITDAGEVPYDVPVKKEEKIK